MRAKFIAVGFNGVLAADHHNVRTSLDEHARPAVFYAAGQSRWILQELDARIADCFPDYYCKCTAHVRTFAHMRVFARAFRQRDNYYGTECAFRCANCACMRVMGAINCDRNAADARHSESNCIPCFIRFILLRQLVAYTVNVFMIIRALVRPWYK